jgi:signal transduction histidine kinase
MARLLRNPTAVTWLPVAVLPPILIADAALSVDGKPITPLAVLAAVVGCLPLVLRRRVSFAVLAVPLTAGIVLVLWALEPSHTVVLIPMVALAELALRGTRRRTAWIAVATLPCVVVSVAPFANGAAELGGIVVRNYALCLLALATGEIVRGRDAEAQRRLGEERLRIAREVHDVVAHAMVAINVQSGVAAHMLDRDPEQARGALRAIKATSGEALADLRATLGVLRDPDAGAPVRPAADVDELAAGLRAAGVEVDADTQALADAPDAVRAAAYRIVQEALTNVLRHADATAVRVQVARDGDVVRVEVADDGAGEGGEGGSGHGLRGMRERAGALGGHVTSGPAPGGGWLVVATLPAAGARTPA